MISIPTENKCLGCFYFKNCKRKGCYDSNGRGIIHIQEGNPPGILQIVDDGLTEVEETLEQIKKLLC